MNLFGNGHRGGVAMKNASGEELATMVGVIEEAREQIQDFNWADESIKEKSLECIESADDWTEKKENPDQAELWLNRAQQLMFEDFANQNGIEPEPVIISGPSHESSYQEGKSFNFRTLDNRSLYARPHSLRDTEEDAKFRIPERAGEAVEMISQFPVQEIIEKEPELWYEDRIGNKRLVVKISGQFYILVKWKGFGPYLILGEE